MTELAEKARRSVLWTTGFTVFQDVLQFGLTLTLTRLLPPEAYGKFSFVTTLIGFFTVISFREFLNHTLQVRNTEETHYQDHFTAGAVMQTSLFLLVNLIAVGLRFTATYAPVAPLLHLMSPLLLLDLVSEFRTKMLERQFEWQRLRTLHAVGLIAGAVVAVTMAVGGFGVYALLVPSFCTSLPLAWDLFVTAGWRPTWEWSAERYRSARQFGTTRIGSTSLVSASNLAENASLTRAVGFTQLGLYNRALSLAALACQRTASLLMNALYPVLTRVPVRTPQYRRAATLVLRFMAWTVIPAAFALAWLAEPLTRTLYGSRWVAAIPLMPYTAALSAILALVQTNYTLLLAHQQQRLCFIADMMRLVGMVVLLAVLLPFGLRTYVCGLLALHSTVLTITTVWLWRDTVFDGEGLIGAVGPALAGSVAGLSVAIIVPLSLGNPPTPFLALAWQGTLFAIGYLAFLRICCANWMREIVMHLPQRDRIAAILRLRAGGETLAPSMPV